jgi:hypothetical protein
MKQYPSRASLPLSSAARRHSLPICLRTHTKAPALVPVFDWAGSYAGVDASQTSGTTGSFISGELDCGGAGALAVRRADIPGGSLRIRDNASRPARSSHRKSGRGRGSADRSMTGRARDSVVFCKKVLIENRSYACSLSS